MGEAALSEKGVTFVEETGETISASPIPLREASSPTMTDLPCSKESDTLDGASIDPKDRALLPSVMAIELLDEVRFGETSSTSFSGYPARIFWIIS